MKFAADLLIYFLDQSLAEIAMEIGMEIGMDVEWKVVSHILS